MITRYTSDRSSYDLARGIVRCAHGRTRVYPRATNLVLTLVSGAANAFPAAWTELIPINTITEDYHPIGFHVESSVTETYIIQFAKAATPTDVQILGEQLGPLATRPVELRVLDKPATRSK